jgi:hypothetical protein
VILAFAQRTVRVVMSDKRREKMVSMAGVLGWRIAARVSQIKNEVNRDQQIEAQCHDAERCGYGPEVMSSQTHHGSPGPDNAS